MDSKRFISKNGWFSLKLPSDWEEYQDGEDGTYAFFNSEFWTGNFRITPFKWEQLHNKEEDKASEFIEEEQETNFGAIRVKLGKFDCVHYKKEVEQDKNKLVVYYWATGKKNNLFLCSFTIDKEQEQTESNKSEIKKVERIIASIEIN